MRPLAKASGTKMADRHEQKAARRRSHKRNPVFLDPLHRRARAIRIAASLSGLLLLVWLSTVAIGIYYIDILPENEKVALIRTGASDTDGVAARAPAPAPEACSGEPIDSAAALPQDGSMTRSAYLRVWPDRSLETLTGHCSGLDTILAEWIEIDPGSQTATWLSEAGSDAALQDLKRASPTLGLELVALLPLPPAEPGDASVLDIPASRARIVSALSSKIGTGVYAGLCLYPRQAGPEHLPGLRALLREMTAALPSGVRSCLVTDAEGALWRDGRLVQAVDSVVLRAFREPRSDTRPGPLAPQAWFETLLEDAAAATGPEKLRVALGSFAVMWSGSAAEPTEIAFAEAMRLVARNDAVIGLDAASLNTRARFVAEDGRAAELWFLDAASLHNQLKSLADRGVSGTVLWTVGFEDPGAWTLVARGAGPQIAAALETVSFPDYVGYEGTGPFRRVAQTAVTGKRRFFRDPGTGLINGLVYDRVPRPVTVERYGHAPGRVIALTFDDGPDPDFTGAILDMLKANGVTATFFVIGSNVVQYPGIVRRMVAEGHEVGSHTFFHPEDDALGPERAQLELNALQRLLASVTGRTTYLFRMPYGRSEGPLTAEEAAQQLLVENEGHLVAGADIVPRDWEGMSPTEIADYVLAQAEGDQGQVVVLHDAGGDRSATVAAVSMMIDRLRAEGYGFVPLSGFLGLSRDEVMPLATDRFTPFDLASFVVIAALGRLLVWIFWAGVAYGVARSLFVLALALLRRRHPGHPGEPPGSVTIAIPAYNEELVIVDAIAAALASDYPGIRVIVVDDGSTDGTAAAVERAFADEPRVRLIRQENGGKCSALNAAYAEVGTEVVVAVDADTILDRDAVKLLMGHFADPRIGAVAGNVRVGNRRGLLARLQALEYITAQNIDRRAAERLNAMLVVPGAIGAWRAEAVRKVGLYSADTITEDADLTVAIQRAGYRVVFEERAFSVTDAPETLPTFMRQRLRWSFGMMQTAWKHRRAAKTARGVGWFSIPDLWVTGILFGLLAPVADAVFLGALVREGLNLAQGLPVLADELSISIIAGWAVLPLIDVIVVLTAFGFERREQLSLALLIPFQRLLYRPLLYVTVYRAVGRALAGRIAGWGKLIRFTRVQGPAR